MNSPSSILRVTYDDIASDEVFAHIVSDTSRDFYVSLDWSPEFYVLQASRGFIAVATTVGNEVEVLLPQLQHSYCVFPNLQGDLPQWQSVMKRAKKSGLRLCVNRDFSNTINAIKEYHGAKSWITSKYERLLRSLHERAIDDQHKFRLCSVALYDKDDTLVAGEIGYCLGRVYTSLTGFCKRDKHLSLGKTQIICLTKTLRKCGFDFFNLGQPPHNGLMRYKAELGGVEVSRSEFLTMWNLSTQDRHLSDSQLEEFLNTSVLVSEIANVYAAFSNRVWMSVIDILVSVGYGRAPYQVTWNMHSLHFQACMGATIVG